MLHVTCCGGGREGEKRGGGRRREEEQGEGSPNEITIIERIVCVFFSENCCYSSSKINRKLPFACEKPQNFRLRRAKTKTSQKETLITVFWAKIAAVGGEKYHQGEGVRFL